MNHVEDLSQIIISAECSNVNDISRQEEAAKILFDVEDWVQVFNIFSILGIIAKKLTD